MVVALNKSARGLTARALQSVVAKRQSFSEALEENADFKAFKAVERNFARFLLNLCIKRYGQVSGLIQAITSRPPKGMLKFIAAIGVTELVFTQSPAHAVVNSCTELAKQYAGKPGSGFINSILRKVAADISGFTEIAAGICQAANLPPWFQSVIAKDWGVNAPALIAEAMLGRPYLDITMRKGIVEDIEGACTMPDGNFRLFNANGIQNIPGYLDGNWWVQDFSARIPARLLTVANGSKGKLAIDLCAAPGGKTLQLAELFSSVIAIEKNPKRAEQLKENLARMQVTNVQVVVADSLSWQPPAPPDAVLLDAPCTASGTVRKHPDTMYTKSEKDIAEMQSLQRQLLERALNMLPHMATLVYSTCSIFKREGEEIIEQLIPHFPVKRLPVTLPEVHGIDGLIASSGDVRILPWQLAEHGGADGFFAARLQKA